MNLKLKPESFSFFYSHLGYRIFVLLILSISVGLLDGFGLAMFMPLLQFVNDSSPNSFESLGKLEFLITFLTDIGLTINLLTVLLIMLLFFSLKGIARFFEGSYRLIIQQYFVKKLRIESVNSLTALDFNYFISSDPGKIQNTLSSEITRLIASFRAYFAAFQSVAMLFVYVALAFSANAQFAVLVTLGGVMSNLFFRFIYKKTKQLSQKITIEGHGFQSLLIQFIRQFQYLKATGLASTYAAKIKDRVLRIERINRRIGSYSVILTAVREPITIGIVVLVILLQVNYLGQNLGAIIMSLLFFYRALTFVLNIQMEWNKFLGVSGALTNMTEFLSDLDSHKETLSGTQNLKDGIKEIRLEKLSFSFGSKEVLSEIDLVIEPKKTVAFVGESGSGKTTLVNLISSLLNPSRGSLFINNLPHSEINKALYRKRIGYITQEPVIFNASVFDNITFWDEPNERNIKRFKEALERASLSEFIENLPQKKDEVLGHNGINLSGGQKQRISIARELYKNVDLLIMDEATSALDSGTESHIKSALENLKGSMTILVIAHRFATIKDADTIVFLSEGRILQTGDYFTLSDNSVEFKKLLEMQRL